MIIIYQYLIVLRKAFIILINDKIIDFLSNMYLEIKK